MIGPGPIPGTFAIPRLTTPEPVPTPPTLARRRPVRAPGLTPGRFTVPRRVPFAPAPIVGVPAFGPAGAGTFVLALTSGTRVTYGWVTEIITTYSGIEQRISWQSAPSVKVEGSAFVLDADDRAARAVLMRAVALGSPFLLAMMSEARTVAQDAVGNLIGMGSTGSIDWAVAGQRVLIIEIDGAIVPSVIQDVTASQIVVDTLPVARAGALVIPLMLVVMESQQGFHRYAVAAETWDIRARALQYGWCGQDRFGLGVQVTTLDSNIVGVDALTDASLIIWDRPNAIDGTASESLLSKADIIDLGGAVFAAGGSTIPDWIRPIKLHTSSRTDVQWLKAITHHLRGRQGMFLLPTGRDDLPFVSSPGLAQVTVRADYVGWFASLAHRRIALTTTGGIVQYLSVFGVVDHGDGTNTLTLSDGVFGVPAKISFLEQVRLESDDLVEVWNGPDMTCDLVAHVVQDTTTTTAEDLVTSAFAGHGLDGDIIFPVGTFVMDRDYHWEVGQFQSGSVLDVNGWVPRFRTACIGPAVGTAFIRRNGGDANGTTGGSGYVAAGDDPILCGTIDGGSGNGASGTFGFGADAPGVVDQFWPNETHPGRGGNGGSGSSGVGGNGAEFPLSTSADGSIDVLAAVRMRFMTSTLQSFTGGGGGGSGSGSGTHLGGGGGGGAGNLSIAAGAFIYAQNIIVQANGGAGGAGGGTDCGGGGGGGGALISICTGRLPFPSTIQNQGGAGGASGGGVGVAGSVGAAGAPPLLFVG